MPLQSRFVQDITKQDNRNAIQDDADTNSTSILHTFVLVSLKRIDCPKFFYKLFSKNVLGACQLHQMKISRNKEETRATPDPVLKGIFMVVVRFQGVEI
jgi:hypothetical protein